MSPSNQLASPWTASPALDIRNTASASNSPQAEDGYFLPPISPLFTTHLPQPELNPAASPQLFWTTPEYTPSYSPTASTPQSLPSPADSWTVPSGLSREERMKMALRILQGRRLSPLDLMLEVLNRSNTQYKSARTAIYTTHSEKLVMLLDLLMNDRQGAEIVRGWLKPIATDIVQDIVAEEMDSTKAALLTPSGAQELTPEVLENWSHDNVLGAAANSAPLLYSILLQAAQTVTARNKNTDKHPDMVRSPESFTHVSTDLVIFQTCRIIIAQLAYQRSNRNTKFHAVFSLFLWSTGCARQTVEALYRCGLCLSYPAILNLLKHLADSQIRRAITISRTPHLFTYDNHLPNISYVSRPLSPEMAYILARSEGA